jgi:hypothetical protein
MKSDMIVNHDKLEVNQEKVGATMKVRQEKMKAGQENMKPTINSISPELEETIKNQVEDGLASVDQWTQQLCLEMIAWLVCNAAIKSSALSTSTR